MISVQSGSYRRGRGRFVLLESVAVLGFGVSNLCQSALELPPGQLNIGVAERHRLSYLQDPDNLSMLKNLAKRFFGDDVAVHITAVNSESVGRKDETTGSGTMSQGDEGSPMVKEALRIFGGSIKTVRREDG